MEGIHTVHWTERGGGYTNSSMSSSLAEGGFFESSWLEGTPPDWRLGLRSLSLSAVAVPLSVEVECLSSSPSGI